MKKHIISFLLLLVTGSLVVAQSPVSITSLGQVYTQNFNALTTGSNWTNGATLPGWYATAGGGVPTNFQLNDGTITTGSPLCSFATSGSGDKSLGFVPNGSNNSKQRIGLRMKNNTGSAITNITITWDAEQWRNGSTLSQSLSLYYKTSASVLDVLPATSTGMNFVDEFVSLHDLGQGAFATELNGKDAANRTTFTKTISLNLPANSEILFVWFDNCDKILFDHFFAIDNVSVTASNLQGQTINFPDFEDIIFDNNININPGATASSGLSVTYSSSNTSVATVSGSNLVVNGAGTTVITASQAGNASYLPATSVQQTLNVFPKTPVMNVAQNVTSTSFTASWTVNNGLTDEDVNYILYVADNPAFTSSVVYTPSQKYLEITGLQSNKNYNFKVISYIGDLYGEDFSNSQSVLTNEHIVNTSGDWTQILGNNTVGSKLIVNSQLNVDTDPEIDELVLNSNAALNVEPGHVIKVNNKLIINSDNSTSVAKILNNGNFTLESSAQIIIRKTFTTGMWHAVGFPFNVSNVYFAGTTTPVSWGTDNYSVADIYVKHYNGAFRASNGRTAGEWEYFTSHQFTANRGYIFWSYNDATYDFVVSAANKGNLLSSSATVSLASFPAANNTDKDWNYTLNPFASSFSFKQLSNGPFYIYNEASGLYTVIMPGQESSILPYKPFFLQGSGTMSFETSGRKLMNRSVENSAVNFSEVNLVLSNGQFEDQTRIRLQDGASDDYVIGSDALKLHSSMTQVPELFTKTKEVKYAVNTLPADIAELDLYVKIGEIGTYTLRLADMQSLNNTKVLLYDKITGETVDMLAQNEYEFESNALGTFDRFKVLLSTDDVNIATQLSYIDKSGLKIRKANQQIAFEGLTSLADINEYDVTGRLVASHYRVDDGQFISLKSKSMSVIHIMTDTQNIKIKTINK